RFAAQDAFYPLEFLEGEVVLKHQCRSDGRLVHVIQDPDSVCRFNNAKTRRMDTCQIQIRGVLQRRMAAILTVRLSPSKLAKVDRRAAELGRDRSGYVRSLIEQDLEQPAQGQRHKFASRDLIGAFSTGQGTAHNATVRRL